MTLRSNIRRGLLAAITIALAGGFSGIAAEAQDRAGRNTPGEWKVTHFMPFGLWDSMCDERTTGEVVEERCYVRYVEVYSPKPQFGAAFAFIVPDGRDGAVKFDFSFERGTRFARDGFRIEEDGAPVWVLEKLPCDGGGTCAFEKEEAVALESVLETAEEPAFVFALRDRFAREITMRWESGGLADAIDNMRAEAKSRSIID